MSVQALRPPSGLKPPPKTPRRVKVPSILQFEAVECGAAALAMILAKFGSWIPLEQLRTACGVSRDGSKASNVLAAARELGLVAKGFKKEPAKLTDLPWPLIVHWNFNHYVVFEGFANGRAYINDPAMGPTSVSMQEFDEAFTGVALAFEPGPDFKTTRKPPGLITALRARMRGSRGAFGLIMVISLGLVIPGLVVPRLRQDVRRRHPDQPSGTLGGAASPWHGRHCRGADAPHAVAAEGADQARNQARGRGRRNLHLACAAVADVVLHAAAPRRSVEPRADQRGRCPPPLRRVLKYDHPPR